MTLSAASHDAMVADMVLHVLALSLMVPLEQNVISGVDAFINGLNALARICTQRGPFGTDQ